MAKRYQRVNQNLYIKEEQTTQWPKEKVQQDKQRSTKHIHKTKDRVTRTPLKTGGEHMIKLAKGQDISQSKVQELTNKQTNKQTNTSAFYIFISYAYIRNCVCVKVSWS
jgi:gas vesicle protein